MTAIESFLAFSERSYLFLFYSSALIKINLKNIFSIFVLLLGLNSKYKRSISSCNLIGQLPDILVTCLRPNGKWFNVFRFFVVCGALRLWLVGLYSKAGESQCLTCKFSRQLQDVLLINLCLNSWVRGCEIGLKRLFGMVLLSENDISFALVALNSCINGLMWSGFESLREYIHCQIVIGGC